MVVVQWIKSLSVAKCVPASADKAFPVPRMLLFILAKLACVARGNSGDQLRVAR